MKKVIIVCAVLIFISAIFTLSIIPYPAKYLT